MPQAYNLTCQQGADCGPESGISWGHVELTTFSCMDHGDLPVSEINQQALTGQPGRPSSLWGPGNLGMAEVAVSPQVSESREPDASTPPEPHGERGKALGPFFGGGEMEGIPLGHTASK